MRARANAGVLTAGLLAGLIVAAPAAAQTNVQFWGTLTLDTRPAERSTAALTVEPRFLIAAPDASSSWRSLDLTPAYEYAWRNWLDAVSELYLAFTHQTDGLNSFELTPRLGARVHFLSRELPQPLARLRPHRDERRPRARIVIRDLVRVEVRNMSYSDDEADSSSVRFRNRLEFQAPINRPSVGDDGAQYLLADWEWFIPLDNPAERFANKQRIRAGLGYRRNASWKIEGLYMWQRSRNTAGAGFKTSDNVFNVRFKKAF